MEKDFRNRVQSSIQEKRHNLESWIESADQPEKECCLENAGEQAVVQHMTVLDQTLDKAESGTLGVCTVCHGQVEESLLAIDYTATICLDDLSDEQRRQLESELEFSSEIQRALLPQQAPNIPRLEIAAYSRPAQIVGGDYFDFFQFNEGSHGLVVADVSGHGFSSSLLMSSLQTALHTLASDNLSVTEVIQRINQYYLHNVNLTTFITIFLAQYEPKQQVLTYCNAGHNPPILFHRQTDGHRSTTWLCPTAAAVGLVEEYKVRSEQVALQPDDILLLYTDGLTEATGSSLEEFGPDRLSRLVAENAGLSAHDLISVVRNEVDQFTSGKPPADDVTVVAGRVLAQ
jgi:sigma-B regulation protein RsbU (phosphoserine phosphatase)